jgi:hypothetical protein
MSLLRRLLPWWPPAAPPAEDLRGPDDGAISLDDDGWLVGDGVIRMPSARGGTSSVMSQRRPLGVVRHGTATAWGTAGAIARSWRAEVKTHSAHLTFDVVLTAARDAEVKRWRALGWHAEAAQLAALPEGAPVLYQHRSLFTSAWHAYGATPAGDRTSATIEGRHFNAATLGIEMTSVGRVAKRMDKQWRGWALGKGVGYGPAVPDDQVVTVDGKSWHRYPPAALESERGLDRLLRQRFPSLEGDALITPSEYTAKRIGAQPVLVPRVAIGHKVVDPTRKEDPYLTGEGRGL